MKEQIEQYLQDITELEYYHETLEMSVFANNPFIYDLSVTRCTSSAMLIADKFNGEVWGYQLNETNSRSLLGWWSGGHDFAIVGNYLVDWWAAHVDKSGRAILDLTELADIKELGLKYLPRDKWQRLELWQKKPK